MASMKAAAVVMRGAITGALILGLVGRAGMAMIALLSGQALNLSLRGTLQVIVLGAVVGAFAGPVLMLLRNMIPASRAMRVLSLSVVLFLVTWFAPRPAISTAGSASSPVMPAVLAIALVLLAFGLVLDAQISRANDKTLT